MQERCIGPCSQYAIWCCLSRLALSTEIESGTVLWMFSDYWISKPSKMRVPSWFVKLTFPVGSPRLGSNDYFALTASNWFLRIALLFSIFPLFNWNWYMLTLTRVCVLENRTANKHFKIMVCFKVLSIVQLRLQVVVFLKEFYAWLSIHWLTLY